MKIALKSFAIIALMAGCASTPKLAPLINKPDTPKDEVESLVSTIEFKRKDNDDGHVQSPNHVILSGSSIVINVPDEVFAYSGSDASDGEFRTKEFFNYAEQEIERVLIGRSFNVLSRSKFEAKLRDLRDESECENKAWWRCKSSKISPEASTILDQLEKQFQDGKITAAEFAKQSQEFKAKFQTSSAGRNRNEGERELTDISEVIRAAQSGDIRSDYILQINNFDTNKLFVERMNLLQFPEIREFVTKNPEIRDPFKPHQYLECGLVGAELNAKLIHVKTGSIVWIGKWVVDELSSGVSSIEVKVGKRVYANNVAQVMQFVDTQNQHNQRISRYGKPSVALPEWAFSTELVGPDVVLGECRKAGGQHALDKETRTQLARQVAKDLISTIVVNRKVEQ